MIKNICKPINRNQLIEIDKYIEFINKEDKINEDFNKGPICITDDARFGN